MTQKQLFRGLLALALIAHLSACGEEEGPAVDVTENDAAFMAQTAVTTAFQALSVVNVGDLPALRSATEGTVAALNQALITAAPSGTCFENPLPIQTGDVIEDSLFGDPNGLCGILAEITETMDEDTFIVRLDCDDYQTPVPDAGGSSEATVNGNEGFVATIAKPSQDISLFYSSENLNISTSDISCRVKLDLNSNTDGTSGDTDLEGCIEVCNEAFEISGTAAESSSI